MERYLGCPISEEVWQYADSRNFVSEANNPDEPHDDPKEWLAEELWALMVIHGPPPPEHAEGFVSERRQRRETLGPLRRIVISELVACVASRREDVISFRKHALNGELLNHEQVGEWVELRSKETKYPHAVLVRLPPKVFPKLRREDLTWELPPGTLEALPIENLAPTDYLDYATPGDRWVRHIPIGRDGVLADLKTLARSLVRIFTWQEAQATIFVLTGITPLLPMIKSGLTLGSATSVDGKLRQLKCLGRFTLTFDPLLTPREVAEHYAELRSRTLKRKPRSVGERQLHLAAFCAGRDLNRQTMLEWNQQFPKWQYDRVSLFSHRARVAIERLLYQPTLTPAYFINEE